MRKLLNKPWFVGLLAAIAVGCVAYSAFPHLSFSHPPAPAVATVEETPVVAEGETGAADAAPHSLANAVRSLTFATPPRDPFIFRSKIEAVAATVEKAAEPDFVDTIHLTAIWTQNQHTFLLVNGRICEAGEQIGRLKIDSATQEGIWVTHWKGRDFVSLGEQFTLNTPAKRAASEVSSL